MAIDKQEQLKALRAEEERLKKVIDKYLSIDLGEMEQIASCHLKAVQAKIKELES